MSQPFPEASIRTDATGIYVEVTWKGVTLDRPCTGGWGLRANEMKLAQRLTAAVNAGAVYLNPVITKDVNGKTFVAAQSRVLMPRKMNADLKRLGF